MATKQAIHSEGLVGEFIKAGIVPDNCRRIVLDVGVDNIVTVYYEVYGDERLLDIDFGAHLAPLIKEEQDGRR